MRVWKRLWLWLQYRNHAPQAISMYPSSFQMYIYTSPSPDVALWANIHCSWYAFHDSTHCLLYVRREGDTAPLPA